MARSSPRRITKRSRSLRKENRSALACSLGPRVWRRSSSCKPVASAAARQTWISSLSRARSLGGGDQTSCRFVVVTPPPSRVSGRLPAVRLRSSTRGSLSMGQPVAFCQRLPRIDEALMRPIAHQLEEALLIAKQCKQVVCVGNDMDPYLPGGAELLELIAEYLMKVVQTRIGL